jgi:2-dehydropantoate 2-reductase
MPELTPSAAPTLLAASIITPIKRIAVMGAGAVGCYFGGMLARAGADVTLIARGAHLKALLHDGLLLESINFKERIKVRASSDPAAVRGAELILFCVKTTGTAEAAKAIAPHLAPGALVVSMQNGVENVAEIRTASGIEALAAVVYVAASLPEPGHVRHGGRGDLVLGDSPQAAAIAKTFEPAGVPCRLTDNLEGEQWQKLIVNCAGNAVTALGRVGYGPAARNAFARQVMKEAAAECREVARAAGVQLPQRGPNTTNVKDLEQYQPEVTSSTAQDVANRRPTEIDSLNGYIARRGAELGVPTPVNRTLHALVKLLEDSY